MNEPARSEGQLADVAAGLLVGGASRRMGRDKAHLMVAGQPAATRTSRLLASLFTEVLLIGGDPPSDASGRRVPDPEGPRCALRGLVGALEAACSPRVVVVATDLPRLRPELLLALVAWPDADAVVPRSEGRLQPLCALYRREAVLPVARAQLAGQSLSMHRLLHGLETLVIEEGDLRGIDPRGDALANANTPEEWARLVEGLESASPGWR